METANNWVLLELSILVLENLEWRWGTAEKEGCSSSAGRLPRPSEREWGGGAGNANDGISDSPTAFSHRGGCCYSNWNMLGTK